jgi:hypothetical protein
MKIAMWIRLGQFSNEGYEKTRLLVMTAATLAAFLGFQLFESFFYEP